jgi:predicted nucleic acid-binding Zn ribbon protein
MKCPSCGADSPDVARFCQQCGTPLAARRRRWLPALLTVAVVCALLVVVWLLAFSRHPVNPDSIYRAAIVQLLYDQDTLEAHIAAVADTSSRDPEVEPDSTSLRKMKPLAQLQNDLRSRLGELTPPQQYTQFHLALDSALALGDQRIALWLQAMAKQIPSGYTSAASIWLAEVKAYRSYRDALLRVRAERPW